MVAWFNVSGAKGCVDFSLNMNFFSFGFHDQNYRKVTLSFKRRNTKNKVHEAPNLLCSLMETITMFNHSEGMLLPWDSDDDIDLNNFCIVSHPTKIIIKW